MYNQGELRSGAKHGPVRACVQKGLGSSSAQRNTEGVAGKLRSASEETVAGSAL